MKKFLGFFWKGKRKFILIAIVIIAFVANQFLASAKPPVYDVVMLKSGPITETVFLNAKTSSANESDIYSESAGEVSELKVKLGDKVKAGDVLMVLKNEELHKRLEDLNLERSIQASSSSNNMESSKLNYDQAKQAYESNLVLFEAGVISKEALENSKFAMENAAQTLKSSQSMANTNSLRIQNVNLQIERVNDSISKLVIKSSIDGMVSSLPYKVGDRINVGQLIARVQDDSILYVNANVNQFDIRNIKIGQKAKIYENLPNSPKYDAEVVEISPIGKSDVQSSDVSVPIKIKFDNSKDVFKANYALKVEIIAKENQNALLAPYEAVKTDKDGNKQVFKVEDSKPIPVTVEYGISGDINVELISDSLKEGDLVILNPDEKIQQAPTLTINVKEQE